MRNVLVRVYDSSGKPAYYARVTVNVYQFMAGGQKEAFTDSDGRAELDLDVDEGAEISIGVNGSEKVSRGKIRGEYRISI